MATAAKTDFGAWFANRSNDMKMAVESSAAPPASRTAAAGGGATAAAAAAATAQNISNSVSSAGAKAVAAGSALWSKLSATATGGGAGSPPVPGEQPQQAASPADVEQGGGDTLSFLPAALRRNPLSGTAAGAAAPEWTCGLSIAQRFQLFLLLMFGSGILFLMSVFLFLPVVIIIPGKFASGFTIASILFMAAMAILRGPRATVLGLLARERLVFTCAYIGSLLLTLYATLVAESYLLTLVAVGVQGAALLWYGASFLPGGTVGMAVFSRVATRAVTSGARGLAGAVAGGNS